MTTFLIVLASVIVISIAGSLIAGAIRKKDFNDQVLGKKPERHVGKDHIISYDRPQAESLQIAADREGMKMKSGQNLNGGLHLR